MSTDDTTPLTPPPAELPQKASSDGAAAAPAAGPPAGRSRWLVPLTVAVTAAVVAVSMALLPQRSSDPGAAARPGAAQSTTQTPSQGTPGAASPGQSATPGQSGAPAASPSPGQTQNQAPLNAVARREAGDPLAIGSVDAPVVMVQFSDFQCGYCRKFALETEPALIEKYVTAGTLRIEWRDFPYLSDGSRQAALAARAAADQGKFWEMHRAIFTDETDQAERLALHNLSRLATGIGIDATTFTASMADKATYDAVAQDFQLGQSIGVSGTPTFLINGRPFVGAQPLESFSAAIEAALAAAP